MPCKHIVKSSEKGGAREGMPGKRIGSKKKKNDERLFTDQRYRILFESSADAIMLLDADHFFDCNRATLDMFGLSKEEFIRLHPSEISPPVQPNGMNSREDADRKIAEAFSKGINRFEWVHCRSNGEEFTCTVWLTAFPLEGRQVLQATVRESSIQAEASMDLEAHRLKLQMLLEEKIIALKKELDDRKKAEMEVRRLIKAVETSFNAVALFDMEMNLQYANHAFCRLANIKEGQIQLKAASDFVDSQSLSAIQDTIQRSMEGQEPELIDIKAKNVDGRELWVQVAGSIIFNEAGDPEGLLAIINDITEKKKMLDALKESETKFKTMVEKSADGVVILQGGKIVYMNPSLAALSGYTLEEQLGRNFTENLVPEERKKVKESYLARLGGKKIPPIYDTVVMRKDGKHVPIEINATIMEYNGAPADFVYVRDLSERKHSMDEIRLAKERLEYILGATNTGYDIIDPKYNVVYVDPTWSKTLGDYRGKKCYDYFMGFKKPCDGCGIQKALKTKKTIVTEEFLKKENRYIEVHTIPFLTDEGNWLVAEFNIDITERKKSEAQLRNITDSMLDVVCHVDTEGNIVYISPSAEKMLGYSISDIMKKPFKDYMHSEDLGIMNRLAMDLAQEIGTGKAEFRLRNFKGDYFWIEALGRLMISNEGQIAGALFGIRDISERRHAEAALRESEQKFRNLADNSPNMIFINYKGQVVYANKMCELMMGYTTEDFYSPSFDMMNIIHPNYRDQIKENLTKHFSGKDILPYEYKLITKQGDEIHAIINTKLIDYHGEPAILGIVTDITKSKHIEEEIRKSEEKYRRLVETTGTGYVVLNTKGQVIDANAEYIRLTGRKTLSQILGHNVIEWTAPHDLKRNAIEVRKCFETGFVRNLELDYIWKDGTITPIEINATVVTGPKEKQIITICRDISERKTAERIFKEREEKYRKLMETANDAIFLADAKTGILIDANQKATELTGLTRDELIGMHQTKLHPPTEVKKYLKIFKSHVKDGRAIHQDIFVIHKDGHRIPVSISASVFELGGLIVNQGIFHDLTERVEAENAVKEADEKVRSLFTSMEDLVFGFNPDGIFISSHTPPAGKLYIPPEMFIGKNHKEVMPPHISKLIEIGMKRNRKNQSYDFEYPLDLQGQETWFSAKMSPVFLDGKFNGSVAVVRDITTKKSIEKALQTSEQVYKGLYESTMALGDLSDLTRIMEVIAEQARNMLEGECSTIYLWSEEKGVLVPYYSNARGDKDKFMEFEIKPGVGVTGHVAGKREGHYANYNDPKGGKAYIPGTGTERDHLQSIIAEPMISENRLIGVINVIAEERTFNNEDLAKLRILAKQATIAYIHTNNLNELMKSEERFRKMGDNIHDGLTIIEDGHVTYINDRATEIYGYNAEELKNMSHLELIIPEDREQMKQIIQNARESGVQLGEIEFWIQAKDGTRRYVRTRTSTSREGDRTSEFIITTDITARKTAEDENKRKMMKYLLEDGRIYLVKEFRPAMSLEAFNDLLNLEYFGLIMSRTPKKDLLRSVTGPFEHFWLGEQMEGDALFQKMLASVGGMKGKSVILIDRLDYLIFKYGFKETLTFIFWLRDMIYLKEQIVIVSMDTSTMKEDELNVMQKEFNQIELRQTPRPSEELFEIAQLIYDRNSAGVKPSFSEIGEELALSKPTFRKRVRNLISLGYAVEVTKGNRKVLELTQKGRSLFFK